MPAAGWYSALRDFSFGPESFHPNLGVGEWAADGLLAIFFSVVGPELKEEFVAGKLRNPKTHRAAFSNCGPFAGLPPRPSGSLVAKSAGSPANGVWGSQV